MHMKSPIKEFGAVYQGIYKSEKMPVLVYCDPGIDDAVMLGQILRNDKVNILAIVCCAGNTSIEMTLKNTLKLCELANRTDIKVFRGSEKPLGAEHKKGMVVHDGKAVYGEGGLGGVKLADPTMKAQSIDPIEYAAAVIRSSSENVTIISTGVLTDVYLTVAAVKKHGKEYLKKIASISMMAGVFDIHNHSNVPFGAEKKWSEFNVYFDPDATEKLFKLCEQNDIKIFMSPLELTHTVRFSRTEVDLLYALEDNPMARLMGDLLISVPEHYVRKFGSNNPSQPAHDLNASMCLLYPDLYQGEWISVECQDSDGDYPGLMSVKDNGRENVFKLLMPQERIPRFFQNYAADLTVYRSTNDKNSHPLTKQLCAVFDKTKKIVADIDILVSGESEEIRSNINKVFLDAQKMISDLIERSKKLIDSSPSELILDCFVKNLIMAKTMFDSFLQTYLSRVDFANDAIWQSVCAGIAQYCALLLNARNQIKPPEKKEKGSSRNNDSLIRDQQCLFQAKTGTSSDLLEMQSKFSDLLSSVVAYARRKGLAFPKVFISYAWPVLNEKDESIYHEEWVQPFLLDYCKHLEASGVITYLDIKDSRMGFQTAEHMDRIPTCSHVVLIGTQSLADKELSKNCMVHTELNLIRDARKSGKPSVIPFLLSGEYDISFPKDFIRYTAIGSFRDQGYLAHLKSIIKFLYLGNRDSEEYENLWRPFMEKYQHLFMPIKRKNNEESSHLTKSLSVSSPSQSYGEIQARLSEDPKPTHASAPSVAASAPQRAGVVFNIKKVSGTAIVANQVTVNHSGNKAAENPRQSPPRSATVDFNLTEVADSAIVANEVNINK